MQQPSKKNSIPEKQGAWWRHRAIFPPTWSGERLYHNHGHTVSDLKTDHEPNILTSRKRTKGSHINTDTNSVHLTLNVRYLTFVSFPLSWLESILSLSRNNLVEDLRVAFSNKLLRWPWSRCLLSVCPLFPLYYLCKCNVVMGCLLPKTSCIFDRKVAEFDRRLRRTCQVWIQHLVFPFNLSGTNMLQGKNNTFCLIQNGSGSVDTWFQNLGN